MAAVSVERELARPLGRVWALVTDWDALRLPLTHVERDAGRPAVGWGFVGVTGVAPVVIRDRMVLTRWQPPQAGSAGAEYAVVKTGRVLAGWAEVKLTELHPGRTLLRWREEIVLHPSVVGQLVSRVTDRAVEAMFTAAVDDLVARA